MGQVGAGGGDGFDFGKGGFWGCAGGDGRKKWGEVLIDQVFMGTGLQEHDVAVDRGHI